MPELIRIIGDGSEIDDGPLPAGLGEKDLLELFRWLVLLRTFDERAVALQRQGRIGTYAIYWGEEATQAGPLYACQDSDWVFPSYRQNAIGILRGVKPATIYAWWRGYGGKLGFYNPREHRTGPICVPIATHLPHAVGCAFAAKACGESGASLAWFGDGATSEGDFHEALNCAAVWKTPTVFFCVNNQWALSTPYDKQTATATIAEKSSAYGMPGILVDGFDPIACWQATSEALDRARGGDGPTLIEASCYRIGPHGTADDPTLYRDEAVSDEWRPLEPVSRLAGFMRRLGVLEDAQEAEIRDNAKRIITESVEEMESYPPPGRESLFEDVFASGMPWTLAEGLAELQEMDSKEVVVPLRQGARSAERDEDA